MNWLKSYSSVLCFALQIWNKVSRKCLTCEKMRYFNNKIYTATSVISNPEYFSFSFSFFLRIFFYWALTPVASWLLAGPGQVSTRDGSPTGQSCWRGLLSPQHPIYPLFRNAERPRTTFPRMLPNGGWSLHDRNSGEICKVDAKGTLLFSRGGNSQKSSKCESRPGCPASSPEPRLQAETVSAHLRLRSCCPSSAPSLLVQQPCKLLLLY